MIKFMYDKDEVEIPKIVPIGNNKYTIVEGAYSGEIFNIENIELEGDTVSFDCEATLEVQEIVTNYVRYLLVSSIEEL